MIFFIYKLNKFKNMSEENNKDINSQDDELLATSFDLIAKAVESLVSEDKKTN